MLAITDKITKTIEKYQMLQTGDFVVLGVSGGADSMLMLHAFLALREPLQLRLLVAHVEHGIRGAESQADAAFVQQYCQEHAVDFQQVSICATDEAAAQKKGVEEYSREQRYAFFRSFASDKIATAHTLSDNVETVLFRLSRGSGLKGACGIPPVRDNIIRPLLECRSEEVRRACQVLHIPYVEDTTNADTAYRRNYIRHTLLPVFEALNPSFEIAMQHFIAAANQDEALLTAQAENIFYASAEKERLRLAPLAETAPSLVKRVLRQWLSSFALTVDEGHLEALVTLTQQNGKIQLKQNVFVISKDGYLRLAVQEAEIDWRRVHVTQEIITRQACQAGIPAEQNMFCADAEKICGHISVRARQAGDSLVPAGRGCTKTLKKLYNELKIPPEKRCNTAVFCDDKGIVGIGNYCVDERVAITDATKKVIIVRITEDIN